MNIIYELFAVDWSMLLTAAVAGGTGLAAVTQLLKVKWIKVPAQRYPRVVSVLLALLVGFIGAVAAGLELASITAVIVFTIVAFVVSGLTYDVVKGLVLELKEADKVQ